LGASYCAVTLILVISDDLRPAFQTFPTQILLIGVAVLNSIYLFSRTRVYDLNLQPSNLVNSPNAKFVATVADPPPPPSLLVRLCKAFVIFWRFLLNISATTAKNTPKMSRIQQLEIWHPANFEKELFLVYSPANFLMWTVTNGSNWIWMLMLMPLVWVQVCVHLRLFRPTSLTETGFEGVDLDQRLPNVGQRQGYNRRRGYARIR